jgi:hypothetical protein
MQEVSNYLSNFLKKRVLSIREFKMKKRMSEEFAYLEHDIINSHLVKSIISGIV